MQIFKIPIPQNSLVSKAFPVIDYSDCFCTNFNFPKEIRLENCVRYSLSSRPFWADILMQIRNILVKPFGLKTGIKDKMVQPVSAINLSKGNKISFFEVLESNDEEVVLIASDKHLTACLSIKIKKNHDQYEIFLSTIVKFHNYLGHVYFFFVKPFHILIMRAMLNRMINHFTKQ